MKKRKRNQNQSQPVSTDGAAALPIDPADELAAAPVELEIVVPGDDELVAEPEPVEAAAEEALPVEALAAEHVVDAGVEAEPAVEAVAEPLDELLAELLALEDMEALEALTAPDVPAVEVPVVEAAMIMEAAAPVEPEPLVEQLAGVEEIAVEATAAEAPVEEPALFLEPELEELVAAEPVPEPEALFIPEPELPPMELLAEEQTPLEEPGMLEETAWVEMPAFESAEMSLEPEEFAMPLPPQPALEAIVGTIDRALESAPAVIAPAETSTTHHKQFSQLDDYIVFSLSGSDYAVPVRDVAEIGRIPSVTRIPNVPDFVRGITNLRGEVVPVLNLPGLLGLQDTAPTARGRIVFLQARDPISPTGLIVDEVKGIQRIQSQQLEQVTGLVDDKVTSVLRGVHGRGERLLNVLDLEQLFQLEEVRELAVR